jgi:DNA-binding transcriptional LysR family regulator
MSTALTRPPDIDELRTFCAAAELGSLGRAAVRLHVSQPGLSKRLAHLETAAGTKLLERSPHGVKLTASGRRLYEEARALLQQAEHFEEVLAVLRSDAGPLRVASSHSATEALVGELLAHARRRPVELVIANSSVVRDIVADGRAELGIAASRPNRTPYPGVRESTLADDAIVCAVPSTHRWARRRRISVQEFQRTAMVMRDPGSNSRWTVEAVLRERDMSLPPALVEAGTPQAAIREARVRNAPVLLSRQVLVGHEFKELEVAGVDFPREYVILLPAYGEPGADVTALIDELRHQALIWCRTRPLELAG